MTDQMTQRLLKHINKPPIRVRVHPTEDTKEENYFSSDDESQKKTFFVYDDTKIPFGKLKGQPHVELLKPENANYRNWILNQSKNGKFYYRSTVKYIEKKLNTSSFDITSNDYIYLKGLENLSDDQVKRIEYFENNLSLYFTKLSQ